MQANVCGSEFRAYGRRPNPGTARTGSPPARLGRGAGRSADRITAGTLLNCTSDLLPPPLAVYLRHGVIRSIPIGFWTIVEVVGWFACCGHVRCSSSLSDAPKISDSAKSARGENALAPLGHEGHGIGSQAGTAEVAIPPTAARHSHTVTACCTLRVGMLLGTAESLRRALFALFVC